MSMYRALCIAHFALRTITSPRCPAVVVDLRRIEDGYLAEAEQLDLERWRKRPTTLRIARNLVRLMDAVL